MNENITNGIGRAWENTITFLPNFLAFVLILALGYVVAAVLGRGVDRLLDRVGFDRVVERGGIKQALSQAGFKLSDLVGKLVFYTLMLFVLTLAFGIFGPNPISTLLADLVAYLPRIFVALVIVVIAAAVAAGVRDIVRASIGGLSYGRTLAAFAGMAVLVVGLFAALNQLNIAPAIVNGLFYALLAIVVGVSIVAIGGGGIQPMRARWERTLNRIDDEMPRVKEEVRAHQAVIVEPATEASVRKTNTGYVS
jgi:hypothetical protein